MKTIKLDEDFRLGEIIIPKGSKINIYEGEDENTRKAQKDGAKIVKDLDLDHNIKGEFVPQLEKDKIMYFILQNASKFYSKLDISKYSSEYIIQCLKNNTYKTNIFTDKLDMLYLWMGSNHEMKPILAISDKKPSDKISMLLVINMRALLENNVWNEDRNLIRWDLFDNMLGKTLKDYNFGETTKPSESDISSNK